MQKYCVYNQTRESFLSLGVTVAEPAMEHANVLKEKLPVTADTGLWLTPYKGIPVTNGLSPFDLLYLDKDYRVIQEVEFFPVTETRPFEGEVASALALPPHTIYSSQTRSGDQLVICPAEEKEQRFAPITSVTVPSPAVRASMVTSPVKPAPGDGEDSSPSANRSRQMHLALKRLDERDKAEQEAEEQDGSFLARFLRWLSSDRRRSKRHPLPGLVAYYWTGGAPQAYHIGDISTFGLFLLTDERWFPGTMILMTLQRVDTSGDEPGDSIPVQSKVVRWDDDGVGLTFLPAKSLNPKSSESWSQRGADQKSLEKFLDGLNLPELETRRASRR